MNQRTHRQITRTRAISRRSFVQGLVTVGSLAILDWKGLPLDAEALPQTPATLEGTHFDLTIDTLPVRFTGHHATATAVNGSVPGPTLRWRQGETVTLAVTNRLRESTSIHWHGIRLPSNMDGVPGLSFTGIAPGETFVYRFPVKQSGTYWYHSHSRFQEQTGLAGALIIEPERADPVEFDRDYVVLLADWTDTDPETIFSNLKEQSDYYNYHRGTLPELISEMRRTGLRAAISDRLTWARMNMSPSDISDVSGATYTYLMNGNPPNANWTGLFRPGERIRLRFINGSSMTFFDVRIPGLRMTVVQADGNDVEPVIVDEFRIGVAEVYDVIVEPSDDSAYTIFAEAEDRSGFARGTLAPRPGMSAPLPAMDPRPVLTMTDIGMRDMKGMKLGAMPGMDMSGMSGAQTEDMPSSGKSAALEEGYSGSSDMAGMDMSSSTRAPREISTGDGVGTRPFPQPGPNTTRVVSASDASLRGPQPMPSRPIRLRLGPQVDQVAMDVEERLHDPGAGLRGNERRVLTYADLRARYKGVDGRPPAREIELYLTGNMERYIWGFNGRKFSSAKPIDLRLGERVRIILINDTMMAHPIHLHGLWSELENGQGEFNPYKHTVTVKPAERLSCLVSADTPGQWAYHCHLLYHMEAGMVRTVVVA